MYSVLNLIIDLLKKKNNIQLTPLEVESIKNFESNKNKSLQRLKTENN